MCFFFQYHFANSTLFYLQRYPTDRAYFIAKEILMTERTYKKDLEILNLVSTFFFYFVFFFFMHKP